MEANVQTNCNPEVIKVENPKYLPYKYLPYETVERARINHPCDTLYVYEAEAPKGYKIVAFPVLLNKPEEGDDGE
jgi:hypothetical protein